MLGILYSERLRQTKSTYGERTPSSDLYVISLMVASKFLHDEGEAEEIFNDEWAEAAGLSVKTVNRLEREFLDAIDWKVYASPMEFLEVCARVETNIALKYGLRRGWFSYTDLTQFITASNYPHVLSGIAESVVKIIGGCVLVYGMSLSILATSVMCLLNNNNNNNNNHALSSSSTSSSTSTATSDTQRHCNSTTDTDTDMQCYIARRRRRIALSSSSEKNNDNTTTTTMTALRDDQGLKDDNILAMALEERLYSGVEDNIRSKTEGGENGRNALRLDGCACADNQLSKRIMCFEQTRFDHHMTQQTQLRVSPFPDTDPMQRFCARSLLLGAYDNGDGGGGCNCGVGSGGGFGMAAKDGIQNDHFERFRRLRGGKDFMFNPSLLGMVIM